MVAEVLVDEEGNVAKDDSEKDGADDEAQLREIANEQWHTNDSFC
jgi:hypothetical protein